MGNSKGALLVAAVVAVVAIAITGCTDFSSEEADRAGLRDRSDGTPDGSCVGEGEAASITSAGTVDCCPGLTPVGCDELASDGLCASCDGASYCTRCGDGICGPGENVCRCPEDCAGPSDCVPEGEAFAIVPDAPRCCPGLVAVGCDEPGPDGSCSMHCAGASYCTRCGDGICGPGENVCRCPEDCGAPGTCVPEGEAFAIVPDAPGCCPGLVAVGCDVPASDGSCSISCEGASYCTRCGDGICGPGENVCRCPSDCGGDDSRCTPEGEAFAIVPDSVGCCPGLVAVGCDEPTSAGTCDLRCAGASFCARCGDGICGLGENLCRCPEDCGGPGCDPSDGSCDPGCPSGDPGCDGSGS